MEWSMEGTTLEELDNMETRLLQDGLRPNADPVERLLHLWHLYLRTEGSMNAARLEVKALQGAHDRENMEVQKKLDQVQVLIAKQNSFNVKYKEENQRLHAQLKQLQLEKEDLRMEVTELLDQGGLGEIVVSSPSEQVAYLLAERSSLLERLQALEVEKCPEPVAVFKDGMDKLSFHKAVPSRGQSSWKKLLGLRKAAQSKQKLAVSCNEVPSEDSSSEHLRLERDLDEASCRLSMAHKEIRRLTDELESAHMTLKAHEAKLQEVESLKQESEKLRLYDVSELHKAKELNERLDKEIRILRDRVRSMDNERVTLLALVDKQMMGKNDEEDEEDLQKPLPKVEKTDVGIQAIADMETDHLRCLEDLKEKDLELCKLQAGMQQLQQELSEMQLQRAQAQQLLGEQEQSHRTTVEALKKELEFLGTVMKHTQAEQQESQKALIDDHKDQECLLQQKAEECAEMKEVLGHTTGLLRTAEAELISGKEKITELEKLNAELNQRMVAEQQEALARMSELEKNRETQSAELQKLLEKSKERQRHLDTEQNLQRQNEQLETMLKQAQAEQQEQHTFNDDCKALAKDQECLLQQKAEECAEMKEVLGHTIGLLRTAEAEVISGKEKITELEKLNAELNQRMVAEQQEALARMTELEKNRETQSAELQKLLEKSKELQRHLDTEQNLQRQNEQDQECLLQQQAEEYAEMKEVLGHTIGLLRTAEAEVLSGKEKITELEKLNAELDYKNQQVLELQEKVKKLTLQLELMEAENERLNEAKDLNADLPTLRAQAQEAEKQRQLWLCSKKDLEQQIKTLEDKLASMTLSEQEFQRQAVDLKVKLLFMEKTEHAAKLEVLELQEQVKNLKLQLELVKVENERLTEAKDQDQDQAQDSEKQRQLQRCSEKDLEIKTLQDKLASTTLSEDEFHHQVVDLKFKVQNMKKTEQATKLESEKYREVKDQLHASQKKLQTFAEEMHTIMDAKDKELRWCHGKINQLKGKLSRAKIIHIKEMEWRDDKIQEHQRKCDFLTKKVDKVTETTKKMDDVNTNLLKENRSLQSELQEKEARSETLRILGNYELRIEYLEKLIKKMENYILDQLWNNDQKTRYPYLNNLTGASQSATDQSTFPRGDTMRDLLDIIQNAPTLVHHSPAQSLARTHTSENGYLNLTPPVSPPSHQSQVESGGVVYEEALQADNRRSCLTERFL